MTYPCADNAKSRFYYGRPRPFILLDFEANVSTVVTYLGNCKDGRNARVVFGPTTLTQDSVTAVAI